MTEQEKRQEEFFNGVHFTAASSLTEEQKQEIEKEFEGLREKVVAAFKQLAGAIMKAAKAIVNFFRNLRKQLDQAAEDGDPNAQYVVATLDIAYWKSRQEEVDKLLKITKATQARRKLVSRKKYIEEQLQYYERQQALALGIIAEGEGVGDYEEETR
jgi:uncharacterized protein (UPF0297 family)